MATISYRSGPEWEQRFGRHRLVHAATPDFCPDFLIESYLEHQGDRWCDTYDANSYLYISKAMDLFDLSETKLLEASTRRYSSSLPKSLKVNNHNAELVYGRRVFPTAYISSPVTERQDLVSGLQRINHHPTLVLGVTSDILFPIWQQREIAQVLKESGNDYVTYYELDALYGHDTFLIDVVSVGAAVKGHLENTSVYGHVN